MKQRYRLFRRGWGVYYVCDNQTGKQESLATRNKPEAQRLLHARNEAHTQPLINRQIARAYLMATDPAACSRTWQWVMDEMGRCKRGVTRERWVRGVAEKPFERIRHLALFETRPEDLLGVLASGTVSTNIFLRRLHNSALDMQWLLAPIIPRRQWPPIQFQARRAITLDEHEKILAAERSPEWQAYYQLLWHLGGSQSDIATLGAEAMRRANYDRARYLGDPAFVQIPAKLTTREYGRQLAGTIDLRHAARSADLGTDIPLASEDENTTHFSIIDSKGMAVANTYTLERIWGSRVVVKNAGVLLNNQMRAFNLFPGHTDTNGMLGTAPNLIAPGKRPISSMTPTIVAKDGRVVLVTGSPGSQAIPHTVLWIMENVIDFAMSIQKAVDSPRLSQEWFPDRITFEAPERYPEVIAALKAMGHLVVRTGPLPQGDAHSILVPKPGNYVGVTDRRRNRQSSASGY